MPKVKVAGLSVSLDGFAAGTAQSLQQPLGLHGEEMFQWFFPTRTFRAMLGKGMAPVVLGQGEALLAGLDLRALGYRTVEHVPTERATHIVLAK